MGISIQPQPQRYRSIRPATTQPVMQMPGGMTAAPQAGNVIKPTDPIQGAPKPPSDSPGPTPIHGLPPAPVPPTAPPVPPKPTMTPAPQPPIKEGPGFAPPPPIDPGTPDFDNNVRGAFFAPGSDPRLTAAQGRSDAAGAAISGAPDYATASGQASDRYRSLFGTGQIGFQPMNTDVRYRGIDPNVRGGPNVDANDPGRYLNEQDNAVSSLGGPSRTELAKQALKDLDTQGAVDLQNRFRKVGQTAAKFGKIGMGDVNAELGSIQGDYERDRLAKENELARSVAEGDISDRFRRVDAVSGLRGQESGIASGLRGEQRTERDYDTNLDTENLGRQMDERDLETALEENNLGRRISERDAGLGLSERNADRAFDRTNAAADLGSRDATLGQSDRLARASSLGTLEDRISGEGANNRDELRTERDFQQGAAQESLDNRIRERGLSNSEREQRLSRAIALMQAGGNLSLEQAMAMVGGGS